MLRNSLLLSLNYGCHGGHIVVVRGFRCVIAVFRRLSTASRTFRGFLKSRRRCSACGVVTTAPPKPSVQTQFVLSKMDERAAQEDTHYEHLMENLDLLFAQVGTIASHQQ